MICHMSCDHMWPEHTTRTSFLHCLRTCPGVFEHGFQQSLLKVVAVMSSQCCCTADLQVRAMRCERSELTAKLLDDEPCKVAGAKSLPRQQQKQVQQEQEYTSNIVFAADHA